MYYFNHLPETPFLRLGLFSAHNDFVSVLKEHFVVVVVQELTLLHAALKK